MRILSALQAVLLQGPDAHHVNMTLKRCLDVGIALMVWPALLGMACAPGCAHAGDGERSWQLLLQDTPYTLRYYDTRSAAQHSQGTVEVRTRTVPTDKGNPRIKEIESLWEFDCIHMLFRNVQTRVVFTNGEVDESHVPYEWSQVRREIWIGLLWEVACKEREDPVQDAPP